jgi:hypothetical protein
MLSGLSEDITAAIVLLQCAEDKMFGLLPSHDELASPHAIPRRINQWAKTAL